MRHTKTLQNIDPVLWGPSAWSLLHAISYHSSSSMDTIRELFEDLKILLPCSKCQASYTRHIEILPFPIRRDSLFKWLYELHHRINSSLQEPSIVDTPPYEIVKKTWKGQRGIEKGRQDSWRFLFFLGMMFPSFYEREKKKQYQEALLHWINEIIKTLWIDSTLPTCDDMHSRTAFIKWLTEKYKNYHNNSSPPHYFLKDPNAMKSCSKTCKI